MVKKIALALVAILIIIQFFRIDKTNPEVIAENDFIQMVQPEENIQAILRTSCYDCHSNETNYPWYTNIAPVSWWVKDHINDGRKHLNFSEWGTYKEKRQNHKLEECYEEVEEGEMPMESYLIMHGEAKLSADQKNELVHWFKEKYRNPGTKKTNALSLNNGAKWHANEATTQGVAKMLEIVNNNIADNQISSLNTKGEELEQEMKIIFEKCNMTGEAHEQLHHFLLPLVKKFRTMKEASTVEEFYTMEKEVKAYIETYSDYFE